MKEKLKDTQACVDLFDRSSQWLEKNSLVSWVLRVTHDHKKIVRLVLFGLVVSVLVLVCYPSLDPVMGQNDPKEKTMQKQIEKLMVRIKQLEEQCLELKKDVERLKKYHVDSPAELSSNVIQGPLATSVTKTGQGESSTSPSNDVKSAPKTEVPPPGLSEKGVSSVLQSIIVLDKRCNAFKVKGKIGPNGIGDLWNVENRTGFATQVFSAQKESFSQARWREDERKEFESADRIPVDVKNFQLFISCSPISKASRCEYEFLISAAEHLPEKIPVVYRMDD